MADNYGSAYKYKTVYLNLGQHMLHHIKVEQFFLLILVWYNRDKSYRNSKIQVFSGTCSGLHVLS